MIFIKKFSVKKIQLNENFSGFKSSENFEMKVNRILIKSVEEKSFEIEMRILWWK